MIGNKSRTDKHSIIIVGMLHSSRIRSSQTSTAQVALEQARQAAREELVISPRFVSDTRAIWPHAPLRRHTTIVLFKGSCGHMVLKESHT